MKLIYYIFLLPLSKIPLRFLYQLEHILFFTIYRIYGYRKQVVRTNLKKCFPEKTLKELHQLEIDFYHYFSKLLIEMIKSISISQHILNKRINIKNLEILDPFYKNGKSIILVGSHYCNWEYFALHQTTIFNHKAVAIGKKLKNNFWNKVLTDIRERFGLRMIYLHNMPYKLKEWQHEKLAILMLVDQTPRHNNAFWGTFFNQTTAFTFGAEKIAVAKNFPIVQIFMTEPFKGHYEISFEVISENPRNESYGLITRKIISNLEQQILMDPSKWLWSHRRWKRTIPIDLHYKQSEQKEKYLKWKERIK